MLRDLNNKIRGLNLIVLIIIYVALITVIAFMPDNLELIGRIISPVALTMLGLIFWKLVLSI